MVQAVLSGLLLVSAVPLGSCDPCVLPQSIPQGWGRETGLGCSKRPLLLPRGSGQCLSPRLCGLCLGSPHRAQDTGPSPCSAHAGGPSQLLQGGRRHGLGILAAISHGLYPDPEPPSWVSCGRGAGQPVPAAALRGLRANLPIIRGQGQPRALVTRTGAQPGAL